MKNWVKERHNLVNHMQEPFPEWMIVFLNSREIHNSLFTMRALENLSVEVVSHTLILCTLSSLFFIHCFKSENTRWLFIEKTFLTACNRLNIQCNRLFQRSNRLYYHFNQLKCFSQYLENVKEQCNRLDSWCNRLKCSWSDLGTLLRVK